MNTNDTERDEWIAASRLPGLIPSCQAGKQVSKGTIRRWIVTGKLLAVRRGRHYFVRREDLERFLQGEPAVMPQVQTRTERTAEERRIAAYLDSQGL